MIDLFSTGARNPFSRVPGVAGGPRPATARDPPPAPADRAGADRGGAGAGRAPGGTEAGPAGHRCWSLAARAPMSGSLAYRAAPGQRVG
ncbi:hypothetical protein GCM10010274_55110 [Streptomyces lavendofoliae]|uniref:Uncharacterized protein n=1 Tax=Streptomyces lavendofoliae TaxID=67314 RepID=A0A918M7J1_9ACTN|nr:hypothetical protein GCM10010274_55110 [Streptomyces lavendofoliae]